MGGAFSKAFEQLPEKTFRKVVFKSLGLTGVLLAVLLWLGFQGLESLPRFAWDWWDWINDVIQWIGGGVMIIALLILFPAIATVLISFFLDDIVAAVNARYYPRDAVGENPPLSKSLALTLRFLGVAVLLNLAVLPIYLFLLWMPLANVVIFYVLNGYLLSREYFELVVQRYRTPAEMRRLRRVHQSKLILSGTAIMFMMTVPVLNLVAPIVATAAMVHLYKAMDPDVAP